MDEGTAITVFLVQVWRLFELESPFFGLKVWQILFGLTVCECGIGIFSEFFCNLFRVEAPSREDRDIERRNAVIAHKDEVNRTISRNKRYAYNMKNNRGWL